MVGRSPIRVLLLALAVAAAGGAGYWAGQQFGSEVDNAGSETPEPVTATARTGTLGEEYPVPISLEWTQDLSLPFLGDTGVVTALKAEAGGFASVDSGAVIGTVDGQPVVVLEGEHPAYRLMALGVSGDDIAQLQDHLVAAGHLAVADANGFFGPTTAQAVREWWETTVGWDRDTVPVGSVIFAGDLPRLLSTDPSVRLGELISTGAPFLVGVSSNPVATVTLTEIQEQRYRAETATFTVNDPTGADVEMTVLGTRIRDRATEIELAPASGRFDEWPGLTLSEGNPTRLSGRMVVTPPTEGTIVPLAALNDLVESGATLRLADGTAAEVEVLAIVGGLAIVDPLAPGAAVVVDQ
ncbi:MAG: peptidoglycan-binding domain-containing protein [Acidimicrobiaceae bacterium]|nr:peptidoglycan-binding domain-containing protein [Acidimicrobiaceae bacterium]